MHIVASNIYDLIETIAVCLTGIIVAYIFVRGVIKSE